MMRLLKVPLADLMAWDRYQPRCEAIDNCRVVAIVQCLTMYVCNIYNSYINF